MSDTYHTTSRRVFLEQSLAGVAVAGAVLWEPAAIHAQGGTAKRYAMVGTGGRGIGMWGAPVVKDYGRLVNFVGLCDINPKRVEYARTAIGVPDAKTYTDFDLMVRETRPDVVIVTTVDAYHAQYAVRAMELGCDVIVEKPMAIDEQQCQQILDTEKKTGRQVTVTFNARYGNTATRVKRILNEGTIGKLISVDYHEFLDIDHGASYFRRWHAYKRNSGSLLVHKATHHFDNINWWIDAEPLEVFAQGRVAFYGKNGPFRGKTCRGCTHAGECDFFWDITKDPSAMDMYVAAEGEDQYHRDACVFREDIDTYDVMGVEVKYEKDIQLAYSLHAFSPYEGEAIAFNGTRGRLDVRAYAQQPWPVDGAADIRITLNFGKTSTEVVQSGTGGHGGADVKLKDHVFGISTDDPLKHRAGTRAGAMSSLIGIAARHSIERGQPVRIGDLVKFS